jgi:hypothetical protein
MSDKKKAPRKTWLILLLFSQGLALFLDKFELIKPE